MTRPNDNIPYGTGNTLPYTVVDHGFDTPCHIWSGSKSNRYGKVRVNGGLRGTHVVAWERVNGNVPDGFVIDHLCKVTACMNVDHLDAVTPAENVRRGNNAKITSDQVVHLRFLAASGVPQKEIAAMFGLARSTVSLIVCRKRWRDI